MRMEPNFEKANEIYFRLGIIYKQQQKFNQSLDVSIYISRDLYIADLDAVFQIHSHQPASTIDRRGHLVPGWSRIRTAERGMYNLNNWNRCN
jgi:hypothetical protein